MNLKNIMVLILLFIGNQSKYIIYILKPLYNAFFNNTKLSGYRMITNNKKNHSVVEENNYLGKIVNAYIVYDLNDWSKIPLRPFTMKNC